MRNTAQSSCPVSIVSCRQYTDIVVLSDIYKRIAAFCQLTKILDYRLLKCFFYTLLYNASEENPDEWAAFQNEALNKDCPYQIVPIMIVCWCLMINFAKVVRYWYTRFRATELSYPLQIILWYLSWVLLSWELTKHLRKHCSSLIVNSIWLFYPQLYVCYWISGMQKLRIGRKLTKDLQKARSPLKIRYA